ncbi:MAG: 2-oxo acid dehydrogenase subunit E2, partial [Pseudomonadota bacterium]|nr:2-oxo acid dehydrogenase subunit E2 [Pseudomonadota bacterium]
MDLDSLAGSVPGGKITRGDVQAAAPATHEPDSANRHVERQAPDPVTLPGSAPESEHAPPSADPVEPSESDSEKGRSGGGRPEPSASASRDRLRATPRARRLAAQQGIELKSVTGTGAGGTITGPDVETAARSQPSAASTDDLYAGKEATGTSDEASSEPVDTEGTVAGTVSDTAKLASGISATHEDRKARRRSATAALMARSAREIPHYYVSETVDVTHALDWLKSHNADLPVRKRVLPAVLFLRATVLAAQKVEDLNGHWVDDTFVPGDGVQLGVAVAMRDGGLLTPVIIDAHLVSLDELMARLADLVRRARSGRLRSREIEPGTITVSSLADRGPDALFGVIYPPQVALVGVGSVAARP